MATPNRRERPAAVVVTDRRCLEHDPGPGHPECPARLGRVLSDLDTSPVSGVSSVPARPATRDELGAIHAPAYLEQLDRVRGKVGNLDPDTGVSETSVEVAELAAGAGVVAVETVLAGAAPSALVLVRPPGHHAEANRAMGFCLLNTAAVAAAAARAQGVERVLVLDWDVHHGNGTQHTFEERRDVLYASVHQFPFYPGTGAPEEVGRGEGAGYTVNCGLTPGHGDADYGAVFHDLLLPVALAFRPELIVVSAGFDAHRADPLASMSVSERGFAAMTTAVRELAREVADGRLVLLLEGGYHLGALSDSVRACLEVLTGAQESFPSGAKPSATAAILAAQAALARYWRLGRTS